MRGVLYIAALIAGAVLYWTAGWRFTCLMALIAVAFLAVWLLVALVRGDFRKPGEQAADDLSDRKD